MKVLEPGHKYELPFIKGSGKLIVVFLKSIRGNHPGIMIQHLLRVIIDRLKFLNNQVPCTESSECILLARRMIMLLEARAARRKLEKNEELEFLEPNKSDGHLFKLNSTDLK